MSELANPNGDYLGIKLGSPTIHKIPAHIHSAFGSSVWLDEYYECIFRGICPNGSTDKTYGSTPQEAMNEMKKNIRAYLKETTGNLHRFYEEILSRWDTYKVVVSK